MLGYLPFENGYVSVKRKSLFILFFWIMAACLIGVLIGVLIKYSAHQPAVETSTSEITETTVSDTGIIRPDRAPEDDSDAVPLETQSPTESGDTTTPQGGGSVTLEFQKDITIHQSEGTADLYFQNPNGSTHDLMVQVVVDDGKGNEVLVAESGLIKVGYGIDHVSLTDGAGRLQSGSYNGTILVLFYDKETGEKATTDSKITDCNITVE